MEFENLIGMMEKYTSVTSSNLKAVGVKEGYLVVFFNNDSAYRYESCAHFYEDLISSESIGRFFREHIKDQSYQRIKEDDWPSSEWV